MSMLADRLFSITEALEASYKCIFENVFSTIEWMVSQKFPYSVIAIRMIRSIKHKSQSLLTQIQGQKRSQSQLTYPLTCCIKDLGTKPLDLLLLLMWQGVEWI